MSSLAGQATFQPVSRILFTKLITAGSVDVNPQFRLKFLRLVRLTNEAGMGPDNFVLPRVRN